MDVLPVRTAAAAENMAVDFLLLQRYPSEGRPRFRHYEWRGPAFTFGYSQKIAEVRAALPGPGPFDLCRRPTGGGIVDHREDWTYALVIPRGNPLEEMRAVESYRIVHECLVEALRGQGVSAVVHGARRESGPPIAGLCFQSAELYDVVHGASGAKIAGGAQKRNKRGLLFQGSIWRPAAGGQVDWDRFHEAFAERLGAALGAPAEAAPWPDLNEDEVSGLIERYASPEWNEDR